MLAVLVKAVLSVKRERLGVFVPNAEPDVFFAPAPSQKAQMNRESGF